MDFRSKDKTIHFLFDVSLIVKCVDGVLQIVGGVVLFLLRPEQINDFVQKFTHHDPRHDPNAFLAAHLLHAARTLTADTKSFAALFLLWHGLVKVGLVWALLRKKRWAYPIAIVAFALFVAYQLERYARTRSPWLLALSVLDVFVIVITWLEYKRLRTRHAPDGAKAQADPPSTAS